MDPRLLRYYNRELQHVREMGAEFAQEFPKIAGRLGMDSADVADPYVERLLEGFAFLAARVQLRIDAEFPEFTQNLLELVYPDYLAPLPSMAVVQFEPVLEEGALADGFVVPRHTNLRSILGRGERTACEFRTAHDVTFWPIEVTEAKYYNSAGALATIDVDRLDNVRAGIRLRLHTTGGLAFSDLSIDNLMMFLKGSGQIPYRLYDIDSATRQGAVVARLSPWVINSRRGVQVIRVIAAPFPTWFRGLSLPARVFCFSGAFLVCGNIGPARINSKVHQHRVGDRVPFRPA